MAYPDSALTPPWSGIPIPSATDMQANITDPLNAVATRVFDGGWVTPALGNSWVAFGGVTGAVMYRLKAGVLWMTGAMKSGTSSTTVFTLPVGTRPANQIAFTVNSAAAGAANVSVSAAGIVSVNGYIGTGSNASVNLQLSFIAEQ